MSSEEDAPSRYPSVAEMMADLRARVAAANAAGSKVSAILMLQMGRSPTLIYSGLCSPSNTANTSS